jgi:hypothetical protein
MMSQAEDEEQALGEPSQGEGRDGRDDKPVPRGAVAGNVHQGRQQEDVAAEGCGMGKRKREQPEGGCAGMVGGASRKRRARKARGTLPVLE